MANCVVKRIRTFSFDTHALTQRDGVVIITATAHVSSDIWPIEM